MEKQKQPIRQCPDCGCRDFSGKSVITIGFNNEYGVLKAYEEEDQGITGTIMCNGCGKEFNQEEFAEIITKDCHMVI